MKDKSINIVTIILISILLISTLSGCEQSRNDPEHSSSNLTTYTSTKKETTIKPQTTKGKTMKEKTTKEETTSKVEYEGDLEYEELNILIGNTYPDNRMELVAEELSKLTERNINTKLNFVYMRSFQMFPSAILMQLDSGDCDVVYFDNGPLYTTEPMIYNGLDSSLPHLISEKYILDISDALPKYAPTIYQMYDPIYKHLYGNNAGEIYSLVFTRPYSVMPAAMVRKKIAPKDLGINTLDQIYTLIQNLNLDGESYCI